LPDVCLDHKLYAKRVSWLRSGSWLCYIRAVKNPTQAKRSKPAELPIPSKEVIEARSEFRYRLRCFLRFSEEASRHEGITVLQYQLLLHVYGFHGREWATIGELAERLQSHHHGVVALVTRCEELGLVQRKPDPKDRRQVQVHLLSKGRRHVERLVAMHDEQLPALYHAMQAAWPYEPPTSL
jgi:DNA-binding MarR family transcriptional regulator